MLTHSQTRELINEIKALIALAENHSLGYSALEHARKLVFHIENQKPESDLINFLKQVSFTFSHYGDGTIGEKISNDAVILLKKYNS